MEDFIREQTNKTPGIIFRTNGNLKISGRSIHENPEVFYEPIIEWVEEYLKHPAPKTVIDISIEYFNSSSAKYVLSMLQTLTKLLQEEKELLINWSYEEGDDDILERGQYYSSVLGVPFNFIETYPS
ncbi:MAG: DUF1987 domain-containing protein [Bacteroidales bacterium]|nr:DUF1987 domain-containing protein [Bacteroidales bacterium]